MLGEDRVWRRCAVERLLEHPPSSDPAANLALEEALGRAGPPSLVLRLWQNPPCVVVGRGQKLAREVDLVASMRDGIPVLRRASGGGTVFHDWGNLNVTVVAPGAMPGLLAELAELIAEAIARLGLHPRAGARGVFVGDTKVSGLACQVTRAGSVAHASLLVTTPADRVGAYLAPAPPDRRPLDSHRAPVSPLCACDPRNPSIDVPAARLAVLDAAAARYGPLRPRPLREAERRWHSRLLEERYQDPSWHLTGRPREAQWTTRPVSSSIG
jgi:lipoate-protein ligase A